MKKKQNVTVYLHVVSVDHNLDDSIPDLLWIQIKDQRSGCMRTTPPHWRNRRQVWSSWEWRRRTWRKEVIFSHVLNTCKSNIPLVVSGILFSKDGNLEAKVSIFAIIQKIMFTEFKVHLKNHLLPDTVVCCFKIREHLKHNLFSVAFVTPWRADLKNDPFWEPMQLPSRLT